MIKPFARRPKDIPRRRHSRPDPDSPEPKNALFQRNRTITGSVSSQIKGTGEAQAQLQSARTQAHHLARQRRRLSGLLLGVVAAAMGLFLLISQLTGGVVVAPRDVALRLDPTYERLIQDYLSGHPFERLRFLLDSDNLTHYLQATAPEVQAVSSVDGAGLGRSRFVLSMRTPVVGWNVQGHQHFVDESGVSFERNYFQSPAVQVIDQSGIQVTNGQAIASDRFLSFLGRVVGQAKTAGYATQQVVIPPGTTRQVDVRLVGVPYIIKFSTDRGAGEQVEDMTRAVHWLVAHGASPQYVDVRVGGKAYYK